MIGAIIGDIVGSIYEFDNIHTKDFPFFGKNCAVTDDTFMTLAIAQALRESISHFDEMLEDKVIYWMQKIGRATPWASYGGRFDSWLYETNPKPYCSFGNGAAMRIAAIPYYFSEMDDVMKYTEMVTRVTHNHPEGIKGAKAVAGVMCLLNQGKGKEDVKKYIEENYYPGLCLDMDFLRKTYKYNETCMRTVPEAFACFYNATSFEDAIRNAISIGGDSDTLACITGAMAECFFDIPSDIQEKAEEILDREEFAWIYHDFKEIFDL